MDESITAQSIVADRVVYLLAGDSVCVVLENVRSPFDIHLKIALSILKGIRRHNDRCAEEQPDGERGELNDSRRFEVCIGLNSGEDIHYVDITGGQNYAGEVINMAARIMGVADPRQILVGEAVYASLHADDLYAGSFTPYKATFKHAVSRMVYQFTPQDKHEGLDTSPPSSLAPGKPPNLSGLKQYDSRSDAELKQEIITAVENATQRVWLLGVALADEINLIHDLRKKLDLKFEHADVKILLLDALRSPAIFRALLEAQSNHEQLNNLINEKRPKPRPSEPEMKPYPGEPFFSTDIYYSFVDTFHALMQAKEYRPEYKKAIRYYAHTPVCWLLVMDDTAYYQPYTFGQRENPGKPSVGDQMPVYRVRKSENPETFSVLEDHFSKLWLTSDSDLFHIGARIADRERLVYLAFKTRDYWFGTVGAVLRQGKDERAYPRQLCTSHGNIVSVEWTGRDGEGEEKTFKIGGVIRDFSWVSLRLVLAEKIFPEAGTVVRLEIIPAKPAVLAANTSSANCSGRPTACSRSCGPKRSARKLLLRCGRSSGNLLRVERYPSRVVYAEFSAAAFVIMCCRLQGKN